MRDPKPTANRRTALAGVGAVGALAAAATLLPAAKPQAPGADATSADPVADQSSGYRLTEHIKRYYATARI